LSDRKFIQSTVTSVRAEWQDIQFCKALNVGLSDALKLGIQTIAEVKLREASPDFTPDLIEQFLEMKRRDASKLKDYLVKCDGQQQLISEILEDRKRKAVQDNQIINVRRIDDDGSETIQASKFDASRYYKVNP